MNTHQPTRTAVRSFVPLLCGAVVLTACGGSDAAERPTASVRDSAGIVIVENPAPAGGPVVTLGANPTTAIGVLEGAPEYQLYEVQGGARLSDGRIAIVNSGSKEVRFYSPDGVFLSATGRQGEGPGEFQEMANLWRIPGDSLLVYDWRLRRLSLLGPEGEFIRSTSVATSDGRFSFPIGMLNEDTVVVRLNRMFGGDIETGVVQDTTDYAYMKWRADSIFVGEPSLSLLGGPTYVAQGGDGDNRWMMMMSLLLAASPETVSRDGRIYYTPGDRYEIRVMDPSGNVDRIIRQAHTPVPVTQAMWDATVERRLEDVEDENWKKRQRSIFDDMPMPDLLPAIEDLRVDAAGRIWAKRYSEMPDDAHVWDVFRPDGEWATSVQTPPRFRPLDLGEDYILGVVRDEFDIEQVRLYDLTPDVPGDVASL